VLIKKTTGSYIMGLCVMTRKRGDGVVITTPDGKQIQVIILGNHGSNIKLGVDAPRDCTIDRTLDAKVINNNHTEN
jgi:carbon storage regulator